MVGCRELTGKQAWHEIEKVEQVTERMQIGVRKGA